MDIDPDFQLPSVVIPCNYYTSSQLDLFCEQDCVTVMHVNCRSLNANFDNLLALILNLKRKPTVIAVSETWTKIDTESLFVLPGYTFTCKSRVTKNGGGVGLFIDNALEYNVRPDLCSTANFECLFVEINQTESVNIIIGSIYRPPNSDAAGFTLDFSVLLDNLNYRSKKKLLLIAGDIILNLLESDTHIHAATLLNDLTSHSFIPAISKPTRITEHSSTLLDNIFINASINQAQSAIIYSDISDHLPILLKLSNISNKLDNIKAKASASKRLISEAKIIEFKTKLYAENWEKVHDELNNVAAPGTAFTIFNHRFSQLFSQHFPIRSVTPRNKNVPRNPWITKGLIKSCNMKSKLYRNYILRGTAEHKIKYVTYKNKLQILLTKAKKSYYDNEFKSYNGNLKLTWKLLRNLMNKNAKDNESCKCLQYIIQRLLTPQT